MMCKDYHNDLKDHNKLIQTELFAQIARWQFCQQLSPATTKK